MVEHGAESVAMGMYRGMDWVFGSGETSVGEAHVKLGDGGTSRKL